MIASGTERMVEAPALPDLAVRAQGQSWPARQCPTCWRMWPFDWDYCPQCAVWIRGLECPDRRTLLVPPAGLPVLEPGRDGLFSSPGADPAGTVALACEVRCAAEQPCPSDFHRGGELLREILMAIETSGGLFRLIPDAGIVGVWSGGEEGADTVCRVATALLDLTGSGSDGPRWPEPAVSVALGIAGQHGGEVDLDATIRLAFRLASLASPNGNLVSEAVYHRTYRRFDYRGVGSAVPKSEPLPGPVFELLGAKPERSGTHHEGPERAPLVGRRNLLNILEACRRRAAAGRATVLHLIGAPGAGKSKLLREWLAAAEKHGRLAGWVRLQAHGVPYGGYPMRAWSRLLARALPGKEGEAEGAVEWLRSSGNPTLIVVDDLHWVDTPSLGAIASLVAGLAHIPALAILAYRPSFAARAPKGPADLHHALRLRGLGHAALQDLVDRLAAREEIDLARPRREEILAKAAGSPLYAEEAVAHLADTRAAGKAGAGPLPATLPDLLILRIQWTLDTALPELEAQSHAAYFRFGLEREMALRRLDALEERVAAWLDRFDAIEEEAPATVRRFLHGLGAIDGRLGLLSIFLGQQRPHCHRLAQGLARIGGEDG